jgi:hypothetical protein
MNTKKDETKKAPAVVDASKFTKGAKPVAVLDKWNGTSPSDIQAGLQSTDLPQKDVKEILGTPIVIIGFQNRQGVIKGKQTDYKIIMAVKANETAPFVFITGGAVVCKKLDKAVLENALPVSGTIVNQEGDDFNYYDLVS